MPAQVQHARGMREPASLRPTWYEIDRRCRPQHADDIAVWAFDLLYHDGRDVRELPVVERKEILAVLIMGAGDDRLRLSRRFETTPSSPIRSAAARSSTPSSAMHERDAEFAAQHGLKQRPDIQNLREVMSQPGWRQRLSDMLQAADARRRPTMPITGGLGLGFFLA